ncbi:ORF43 [Fowl aviadenovirus 4]|uniref:ORF43 n=1 Tax=Fowl aviadenovirus C TaxID=190063 RepID=F2VJJ2_9ADEN|nr:ORF43 [Fowl aviadenovirus C]YP_010792044.1 ORF43 [Fowl aviadenovirus C]ADQ39079.1 ORF43 [Fowl aviadenovirus C]UUS54125.1 ORF43 [Fowl aviadenovirus 4]CCE39385.1 ORF43 [Fowl aviadenovirus C]
MAEEWLDLFHPSTSPNPEGEGEDMSLETECHAPLQYISMLSFDDLLAAAGPPEYSPEENQETPPLETIEVGDIMAELGIPIEGPPTSPSDSSSSLDSVLFSGVDLYDLDYTIVFSRLREFWQSHGAYLKTVASLECMQNDRKFQEAYCSLVRMHAVSEDAKEHLNELLLDESNYQHCEPLNDMLDLGFRWLNDLKGGMEWCMDTALDRASKVMPLTDYQPQ